MSVIGIILIAVFVFICILLVALVLLQNEEGEGLGGLFGGGGSQAFGSRSVNVLTKTTYIFVTLFFVLAFLLAFIHKSPTVRNLDPAVQQIQESTNEAEWWKDGAATENVPTESPATTETPTVNESIDVPSSPEN